MKKILSLLLILMLTFTLALSFVSCTQTEDPDEETETPDDPTKNVDFQLSLDKEYYIVTGYGIRFDSIVEIPAEHEGKPVKAIGDRAFSQSTLAKQNLKEIIIPESVSIIGDYAFADCSLLEKVTIKGVITKIGEGAFSYCQALKSISLPEGLIEIGDNAFDVCSVLEPMTIPSTVEKIGIDAFRSCAKITGVKATSFDGVYTLPTPNGAWVLKATRTLTDANLPDNAVGIAGGAFKNCSSLKVVEIPKNVMYIGENAFYGVTTLTTVNYSNTQAKWYTITIEEGNIPLLNATINCE